MNGVPATPAGSSTAAPPAGRHRLLAGAGGADLADAGGADLAGHLARYGPPPRLDARTLVDLVEWAGLRGRGGAGFPTGRKLAAVAGKRRVVVVANACEGEPVSSKDHVLLETAPHLVLDGATITATALCTTEIIICVHRGDPVAARLRAAVAQRSADPVTIRVVEVPARYVASEESALVNFLNTGTARPTAKPPRPYERGVRGRPTLVANVETLAHLSLIARYGPDWFRTVGTPESPGTTLVTISGAVSRPGVYEVALGTPLGRTLALAGPATEPWQAVLVGGFGGGWLPMPQATGIPLTHADLQAAGAALGVAALVALPVDTCGLAETARIGQYLADESARQCGPCMFGLPAVAADLRMLVLDDGDRTAVLNRLNRRLGVLPGRGGCGHPDGFARLVRSAVAAFPDDLHVHASGGRCRWVARSAVPVPRVGHPGVEGWR